MQDWYEGFCFSGKSIPRERPEGFIRVNGKRNTWYVGIVPAGNRADHIYCDTHDPKSEGFGWRTLIFYVSAEYRPGSHLPGDLWQFEPNGFEVEVLGPWHSNANSLKADTGWDLTREYLTQGLVARESRPKKCWEHSGLLHLDGLPVLGTYDRVEKIAKELTKKLGRSLSVDMISSGGGSAFWTEWEKPDAKTNENVPSDESLA